MADEILSQFLTSEGLKKFQNISDQEKKQIIDILTRWEERVNFSYLTWIVKGIKNFIDQWKEIIFKVQKMAEKANNYEQKIIMEMLEKAKTNITEQSFRERNLQEISELWSSGDKDFIRIFKQLPNEQERIKEFQRSIHREFLESYVSNIIIFCEEMRNLSKFTGDHTTITNDIESYVNGLMSNLLTQTKMIGLDINYVPLFHNYEQYAAFAKLVDKERSSLYARVNWLKKNDISEILSYGFWPNETNVLFQI